jgi:uncharacterized protein (TIGR02246 family)
MSNFQELSVLATKYSRVIFDNKAKCQRACQRLASQPTQRRIAMRPILPSLLIVFLSACSTMTGISPEASRQEVAAVTDEWRAAYDSREPKRITALYAADAALWGTTLKAIATTPAAVAEYFKGAPARPDARVVFGEQNIRVYGDLALNSGAYTFNAVRDGKPISLPARFSLAFRKQEGKWMIVDHHSSWLP